MYLQRQRKNKNCQGGIEMKTRFVSFVLVMMMCFLSVPSLAENVATTNEQMTALAMLNHLTVLTQETNDSRNSRLFMEQAYSELINNTYPNSVDSRTLSRLTRLLDTMEKYRMINVKRERLQYIYEQNQARAIRSAIPNPLGMLSAVHSLTPARLVASIAYMAVDAAASYESAKSAAELQFLKDGWQLDDEEAEELHQSRKDMFAHMVNIVNDYKFDGDLALTEETVTEFSRWKNEENIVAKIQFLESNKDTYQAYGGYWLTLAESYYANGEFQKCIESILTYENMAARIFRRDFEYARVLPLAIAASEQINSTEEYAKNGGRWADAILANTKNEDWALRYFAAQTYISIYDKTKQESSLRSAYNAALDNVTNLLHEQQDINATYLSNVQEVTEPKGATQEKKNEVKKVNEMLKETRKTELTPASEALLLNCDLLFAVADLLKIDSTEQARVDAILHPQGARLFLNESVDNKYWFSAPEAKKADDIDITFGGTALVLPVTMINSEATIEVSVKEKDAEEPIVISDWRLDKVERKEEGKIDTFGAFFLSEEAKKHIWGAESSIVITIKTGTDDIAYEFKYTTVSVKKEWYEYITKAFSGHKNEWYDYLKVWDNTVDFDRVFSDGTKASERSEN